MKLKNKKKKKQKKQKKPTDLKHDLKQINLEQQI
jgi:hypothetical protein